MAPPCSSVSMVAAVIGEFVGGLEGDAFEDEMHAAYPQNSHVREKIRQQMQVLRDLGYVEFAARGEYRLLR